MLPKSQALLPKNVSDNKCPLHYWRNVLAEEVICYMTKIETGTLNLSKFINAVLLWLSRPASEQPYTDTKNSELLTLFEGQKYIKKNENAF